MDQPLPIFYLKRQHGSSASWALTPHRAHVPGAVGAPAGLRVHLLWSLPTDTGSLHEWLRACDVGPFREMCSRPSGCGLGSRSLALKTPERSAAGAVRRMDSRHGLATCSAWLHLGGPRRVSGHVSQDPPPPTCRCSRPGGPLHLGHHLGGRLPACVRATDKFPLAGWT